MTRYAETFFRYWLFLLVPLIVPPTVALIVVLHAPRAQFVTANIWVDQSVTTSLSSYNQWQSPAQNVADTLTQLVQSPSFDVQVAHASPLYMKSLVRTSDVGRAVTADFTANVHSYVKGDNLLAVAYACTCGNGEAGLQIVTSLLATARNTPLLLTQQQAKASLPYYAFQLQSAQQRLLGSTRRLSEYLQAHHVAPTDLLTAEAIDPALAALYQQYQTDQTDTANAQQQLSKLRTQSTTPPSLANQAAFRIVDAPSATPVSSRKKDLINLGVAALVGLLLCAGFVVVKTALDRSLRYPSEVTELLDLPVLAVVPYSHSLAQQPARTQPRAASSAQKRVEQVG